MEAIYWRTHDAPLQLAKVCELHGVQWSRSIILSLDVDLPGMPTYFGLLLSQDERFIEFAVELDADLTQPDRWHDVSNQQNFDEHNRGTGVGYGALALKIFRELNMKADTK
ncbi:hypothetical protein [Variovorax sp. GB4P3]